MIQSNGNRGSSTIYWIVFILAIVVAFCLGLFISSIATRKAEKEYVYKPKVEIKDFEPRNELWGENFPKEFESYYKTKEGDFLSKYNGNAMIDMLEIDPRLVVLWAGYGFAKDYNQGRGHYYAIEDVYNTLRTGGPTSENDGPMPATCWTCKSPDVPRLMNEIGITKFYTGKWSKHGSEIVNPIGCADCHDPETQALTITRPALIEAFTRMGKDIKDATHQEMRSLVCAQCHVEYYFDKREDKSAYLTFPWDNGTSVEQMEKYYDERKFKDWTHKLSKAPMLKTQHPGWEVFNKGVHAQRGLSCADCHMPYKSEAGQKFTDHHIQSPLNNIENTCQVCHRESAQRLKKDVHIRQNRTIHNRNKLEEILVRAHVEAKKAWDLGATEKQMHAILQDIRHAQWRWDYAAASHGGSFHAPVEIGRIIGTGINIGQEARIKLARLFATLGYTEEVPYPDISTKAKAQKFIGLPMEELKKEKEIFKKNLLPKWLTIAQKRHEKWGKKVL